MYEFDSDILNNNMNEITFDNIESELAIKVDNYPLNWFLHYYKKKKTNKRIQK